jgi:LuxR family transcriptional regulator, maltose regulon positive regulatory protein
MAVLDSGFATKCLTPKCGTGTVSRHRLLDILHSRISLRAQVIIAPAGYGKTTLLADFATELEAPTCWYNLDSSDQDPRLLLEGLLNCLRIHFNGFGALTEARLNACKDAVREAAQIVGSLTGEIHTAIPDYLVLVIEDYHLIEDSAAKGILDLLLERAPDNCQVVITSRTPVELPALARLQIKQLAAELDASHLAFNPSEIKDLLVARYGLEISDNEAVLMAANTEGWIVSILLATLNMPARKTAFDTMTISHKNLFRYLTSEVFDQQPPEIQAFLLISSTLEKLEPELCDRLIGARNSLQIIRTLEKESLFLQCVDYEKACYRFHQLFRQFLQRKLHEDDGEKYFQLHVAAGFLFEEYGRFQEAVSHFLEAKSYGNVVRIIKSSGPGFLQTGKCSTVARWIEAVPESQRSDVELTLLFAQSLIYLGKADESARLLTAIIDSTPEDADYLLRAKALNWRNAALRLTGQATHARSDIETAVRILERHNGPASLLGEVYKRLGKTQREMGKFKAAERYFKLSLKHFSLVSDLAEMSDIYNSLGIIYKRLCKMDQAGLYLEKARQGWTRLQNHGYYAMTMTNITYLYQRRGLYDLAQETLKLALASARQSSYPWVQGGIMIATGEILRDVEKYKDALDAYQKGLELAREVTEPALVAWAKAGLGETHRLLGNRDKADLLLKEAVAEAGEQGLKYEATLFSVQSGIMAYEKGEYDKAINSLTILAGRMTTLSDEDALAKIYFHLAQACYLSKRLTESLVWLSRSCALAEKIGYDEFMLVEGRKAIGLMEYAVSNDVNAVRFTNILKRLRLRRDASGQTENMDENESPIQHVIHAYALGKASVSIDSRPVDDTAWRSNRAKEIFFYLLCSNTGQTKEAITAAIWPDLSPERATSNFHINIYRIRRAIDSRVLILDQGRYQINPKARAWFDVSRFEHLIKQNTEKANHNTEPEKVLEQAVELYQGPFLSNIYSDWVEDKRRALEDNYLKTLLRLARLYSQQNRHDKSIAALEKCLVIDAYQDEIYCQLIEQYLSTDDTISASRVYKRFKEMTGSDPGYPPSARMRALGQRILAANR